MAKPQALLARTSSLSLGILPPVWNPHCLLCQLNWYPFFHHRVEPLCPHSPAPSVEQDNQDQEHLRGKNFFDKIEKTSPVILKGTQNP